MSLPVDSLKPEVLGRMDAYWRAANYLSTRADLSAGQPAAQTTADAGAHQTDPTHPYQQSEVFDTLLKDLDGEMPDVIGHCFVYGGEVTDAARVLDEAEFERLRGLIPLAPLHLPGNQSGGGTVPCTL